MTSEIDRELEHELAELTAWRSGETSLWKSALAASGGPRGRRAWFLRPWPLAAAAGIVVVLIGAIVAGQLGRGFDVEAAPVHQTNLKELGRAHIGVARAGFGAGGGGESAAASITAGDAWMIEPSAPRATWAGVTGEVVLGAPPPPAAPSARHVVRRATMELATSDVRATYEKAMQLASTARGEFVQAASIGGDDEHPWAQLTLRVGTDRLDEVLNRLRSLGVVRTEDTQGDDVTAQVVDLEARLRNERRIEQELLELMDGREKDPIKDVLELRTHLSTVRQHIESLEGQAQHLDRLVSLATILVIIRPETDDEQAAAATGPQPILEYFGDSTARAWRAGLLFLADTVAGLIRVVVGGLVWWTGAIAALAIAHRAWRRRTLFGSA